MVQHGCRIFLHKLWRARLPCAEPFLKIQLILMSSQKFQNAANVIAAPHQVRDKLQQESSYFSLLWIHACAGKTRFATFYEVNNFK